MSCSLGLPKASVHRLLASLRRRDLVERDEGGRYRPGMGLVALGLGVLEREPVVAAARPELEMEALELGETVFVVAPRAGRLCVLDKVEGRGLLRASPSVGASVPVHATAAGKLFLGLSPERVTLPDGRLERFTDATPSRQALAVAARRAAEGGWAASQDEWISGLSVVAAPVFARGALCAAIAVAAASPRMRALGFESVAARAVAAAARTAARLSGPGPTGDAT